VAEPPDYITYKLLPSQINSVAILTGTRSIKEADSHDGAADSGASLGREAAVSLGPELAERAVAAASDAIVTLDSSGKVLSWNHGAERLLGFSHEDALEHGLALIIPAEYIPRHIAGFHQAMDSGRLAHGGAVARVEAMTASGQRLVLGLSLGLMPAAAGKPAGVVGVLRPLGTAVVEFVAPDHDG